jgi:DNA-binding transcriptional MerR regulator
VLIEQLKAAGMSLAEIRAAIGPEADLAAALRRRLAEIEQQTGELDAQRSVTVEMLSASPVAPVCSLVTLPATAGVVVSGKVDVDDLAIWIRRHIQRLRRRVRTDRKDATWTFAARFGLDVDDAAEVELAALAAGERDLVWPSSRAVQVDWIGSHAGLPVAYDAALAYLEHSGLRPTGRVQETYHAFGRSPHTSVAVLIDDGDAVDIRGPIEPPAPSGA